MILSIIVFTIYPYKRSTLFENIKLHKTCINEFL